MIKTALRAPFFMAKLQKPESNGYVNHTVDTKPLVTTYYVGFGPIWP